ncbi:MAG: HlyD family secretion protein, partial [Caulobacteraceae bacterium]
PKVRGMIEQVMVSADQTVRAGEPMARIDPAEYEARLAGAKGDLLAARAAEEAALAGLARLDAEEAFARAQLGGAEKAAGANGASDPALRSAFETARAQAVVAARSRGEIAASLAQARASAFRARTALDFAGRDLANTTVRAPADGVVGDLTAEVGAFVQPGMRLMVLVSARNPWVLANFKETQIGAIRTGQRARVRVDAIPGRTFTGVVAGLAPGSGSEFALIPFEPGAGNFTKIIQRVAVRIALDPGQAGLDRLRPGLSAVVTVATKIGA